MRSQETPAEGTRSVCPSLRTVASVTTIFEDGFFKLAGGARCPIVLAADGKYRDAV